MQIAVDWNTWGVTRSFWFHVGYEGEQGVTAVMRRALLQMEYLSFFFCFSFFFCLPRQFAIWNKITVLQGASQQYLLRKKWTIEIHLKFQQLIFCAFLEILAFWSVSVIQYLWKKRLLHHYWRYIVLPTCKQQQNKKNKPKTIRTLVGLCM